MLESIVTVNLKLGSPTVEEARQVLKAELERCRNRKVTAIKVIHGYGSSGVGGALRQRLRRSLISRRKEGSVSAVVFGEKWDIFDAVARSMLEKCPALRKDEDLGNCNPGISMVLL
ncbi:MAG TPA: Smr/MutS family protein [Terriglobales bacterium]|nr:Smr/MutS family protein [Terriglobales bacterium]